MLESEELCAWKPIIIPDNPNWRRHKSACPFYREHWFFENERSEEGLELLYQSICLQNTPPETLDDQERCMQPRRTCWRTDISRARRKTTEATAGARPGKSDPGD